MYVSPSAIPAQASNTVTMSGCAMPNVSGDALAFVWSSSATCFPPTVLATVGVTVTNFTAASDPSTDARNTLIVNMSTTGTSTGSYLLCMRLSSTHSYTSSGLSITVGMLDFLLFAIS